jgi:hypothetical protein
MVIFLILIGFCQGKTKPISLSPQTGSGAPMGQSRQDLPVNVIKPLCRKLSGHIWLYGISVLTVETF